MSKIAKAAVLGAIVIAAGLSYITLSSSPTGKKISNQEVDFATLSETEIDVIEGAKERMTTIVPSAQAAE